MVKERKDLERGKRKTKGRGCVCERRCFGCWCPHLFENLTCHGGELTHGTDSRLWWAHSLHQLESRGSTQLPAQRERFISKAMVLTNSEKEGLCVLCRRDNHCVRCWMSIHCLLPRIYISWLLSTSPKDSDPGQGQGFGEENLTWIWETDFYRDTFRKQERYLFWNNFQVIAVALKVFFFFFPSQLGR